MEQKKEHRSRRSAARAGALCILVGAAAAAPCARASCLALPSLELHSLDAQAERQPDLAIRDAQARLAADSLRADPLERAELFAVLADAYTEQSQLDKAHAAVETTRGLLQGLASSAAASRLQLRIDLVDDQLSIAASDSLAALADTTRRLDGLPGDTLERACTLSMRATAYDYLHQPDRAVADALEAYRIARSGNWANARLEAADTLARKFAGAGLFSQAEMMISDAITLAKADNRTSLLSTLEYERGMLLVNARRFADARTALEQSIVYASQIGDRFSVAATNATLCWALLNEGDLGTADTVCNTGDEDLASGHRDDLETSLIGYRGRLDLAHQRPAAALDKLNRILTPRIHALLPRLEPELHWERALALGALHRYREANSELVRMHQLEEAADSAQRNRQVAVLSAVIASEGLAASNRELRARMVVEQAEVARQHELRRLWVLLSFSAFTISMLLGYLLWTTRRHGRITRHRDIILRSAGTHAPDAFLLLDAERRVMFANRNLCGHGRAPAVGEPVESTLPRGLSPTLMAAIDEAFGKRTMVTFPAIISDQLDAPRHLEMCVVPAVDHEHIVGGTLRAIDVTEQLDLERQVLDGASHERQRLSSELHEGLGQQLAGVLLMLGNASNVVRRRSLNIEMLIDEIAGFVRQAIDTTRELARGLAPVKVGSGSLPIALQRLVGDASLRLQIEVTCDCQLEDTELSELAADHLYSICREAITNAALHGRCTRVEIAVYVEADLFTMSIWDNGLGFSSAAHESQGIGVRMMAYRTRLLGGMLKMTAPPTGGTCVCVTVPLTQVVAPARQG